MMSFGRAVSTWVRRRQETPGYPGEGERDEIALFNIRGRKRRSDGGGSHASRDGWRYRYVLPNW
jgi:hypothetical protein